VRAVVQRVTEARVRVDDPAAPFGAGRVVGEIGRGLVVLLGVGREDTADDVVYVAAKIRDIRVFEGETGRNMDRSVADIGGGVLVVSQFTLYGDI
jgi:D-tyrosyl-tRNA(Tyr) deacylase